MKIYKVKNESGQSFDVDEDKVHLAEKDGYLPVVVNGRDSFRVSMGDIGKAKADGYKLWNDYADEGEAEATRMADIKEEYDKPLGVAVRSVSRGLSGGLSDEIGGALGAVADQVGGSDKSWGDSYRENRDDERRKYMMDDANHGVATTVGRLGGGLISSMIVPGANTIKGAAAMGGVQGLGESEADLTKGEWEDAAIDVATGAAIGGGTAYGLPKVVSGIGKGVKEAARLLPGTEDAFELVNKGAATISARMPGTDYSADELADLLNDPATRRAARSLKDPGKFEGIGTEMAEHLKQIDSISADQVGTKYGKAEFDFLNEFSPSDMKWVDLSRVQKIKNIADARPNIYGKASKYIGQMDEILQRGGADEIGTRTEDMSFEAMKEAIGDKAAAKKYAKRLLDARRHLDDVTKNVNFEKLLEGERKLILEARDSINKSLDNTPGATQKLRQMDRFYSEYKTSKKDALHKLGVPLPSGGREFTPESALKFLKSDADQSKFIEAKLDEFGQLMNKLGTEGAGFTDNINNNYVKKLREGFKNLRSLESLKRASGGPTSQAVNMALQLAGVFKTGGLSLLALPITNPSAWLSLVDSLEPSVRPFMKKIQAKSLEWARGNPGVAVRLMLVDKVADKDD